MAAGDTVLKETADRILEVIGPGAFVARLGADEFAVLLRDTSDMRQAKSVCDAILPAFSEPFHVHGSNCHLGVSIGVVLCCEQSSFEDANAVLKSSLLALHQAKKEGGRRYKFFRPQLLQEAEDRRRLDEELRLAFVRGEFELHFQPQLRLDTRRIVGAEALLRWRHPTRGLLGPSAFLVALENSDIAIDVGRWIINTACAFAADLTATGTPIRVGLNLFSAQLHDETLYSTVTVALATHYLPPHLLELEITETTVLGFDENIVDPLRQLRKLGVGIAFDDYGTGFGSLSLLKRYPLTRLKIDIEFVRGLLTDPDDAAIVKAVLGLGRSMGFHVTAEGVETEEQAKRLRSLRCEEVQGFLFGKAMTAAQFRARLAREISGEAA
jgi:predicted signal transduction protein with EAL and GGDEF domain